MYICMGANLHDCVLYLLCEHVCALCSLYVCIVSIYAYVSWIILSKPLRGTLQASLAWHESISRAHVTGVAERGLLTVKEAEER